MTLLHYDLLEGPAPDAPVVMLSAGLGGLAGYWAPQVPALRRRYRVLAYDQRGTGRNRQDLPDGYAIADMAAEVAAMLDAARIERCHFVGHALGGLVGLALAGFLVATPVFVVALCALMRSRNLLRDALAAVGLTGAVWLLFDRLLHVSLP